MNEQLIINGTVVTLGATNQVIESGAIYIKEGKIADIGATEALKKKYPSAGTLDAQGKLVMPGFICAHHHFYSSLARGFAPPGEPAFSFQEILERLWWKLDRALTEEDVRYSALLALIDCIRHGTTTILDHHASPSCRDGSLDVIADAVLESGLRASLCYEVSDRNVPGAGIVENARFLERLKSAPSPFLAGMMGIHASFTVSDETLKRARDIAEKYDCGYHIHVAEGSEDADDAQEKYGLRTVERLVDRGICGAKSLFIHCIHLTRQEIELLVQTQTMVVHNPESNMNNAVGVSRVLEMLQAGILVGLGTDGMSSNMPAQARVAYLLHRLAERDPRVAFVEAPQLLLENNARIVSRYFSERLGAIEVGAAADLAILDYIPPTPLHAGNFLGHFLFGISGAAVDSTIVAGKLLMRNKQLLTLDEEKIANRSRDLAQKLWPRIQ